MVQEVQEVPNRDFATIGILTKEEVGSLRSIRTLESSNTAVGCR